MVPPRFFEKTWRWFSRLGGGLTLSFRRSSMSAALDVRQDGETGPGSFGSYPARMARYAVLWGLYESTAYDDIHFWARDFRVAYSLYPNIRNILNPAYRLAEFWATHLMGGALDPAAGDGSVVKTALPILDADDPTRAGIAQLWKDSDWEQCKNVWTRLGTALGDVALKGVDDPRRGKVAMRVVDPRTIADADFDPFGNCRSYVLEEWRPDPSAQAVAGNGLSLCRYREVAVQDGPTVRYATYKDDQPFAWDDHPDGHEWAEDLPFVPFVMTNHCKILADSPWGFAEVQPAIPKLMACDGTASRLLDFIAKSVDSPWLFAGLRPAPGGVAVPAGTRLDGNPAPKANEIPALYGPPEARAQALIAPLDIESVVLFLSTMQEDLKDDFPELRKDIESATGDASGKALRVARQRCEAKAQARRSGYDASLTRMIGLCLRIGAMRGYDGYAGIDHDATASFRIGHRSVFETDPLDKLELDEKFWAVAESADRAGCPLPAFLETQGWPPEKIAAIDAAREDALDMGLPVGRAKQAPTNGPASESAVQAPGGAAP